MPELDFEIQDVKAVPYAAAPTLAFKLRVTQTPEAVLPLVEIHSVILRCQVRLEPARRRYSPAEQQALHELYGEPHRWGQTVRSTLWTNVAVSLPPFEKQTAVELLVPCTWDFNIAATKYFDALEDGQVPLSFLFSGTIFYLGPEHSLQVAQISWEKEAAFSLPVSVWRQMIEHYYPNSAWLCLRKDVFDRLGQLKSQSATQSWDQVIESLLDRAEARGIAPRSGQ